MGRPAARSRAFWLANGRCGWLAAAAGAGGSVCRSSEGDPPGHHAPGLRGTSYGGTRRLGRGCEVERTARSARVPGLVARTIAMCPCARRGVQLAPGGMRSSGNQPGPPRHPIRRYARPRRTANNRPRACAPLVPTTYAATALELSTAGLWTVIGTYTHSIAICRALPVLLSSALPPVSAGRWSRSNAWVTHW